MRGILLLIKALLVSIIVLFSVGFVYSYYYLQLSQPLTEEKTIIIPKGSLAQTSEILEANGVIRNHYAFMAAAVLLKMNKALKAGEYKFEPGISTKAVLDKIARGDMVKHSITIPEGLTTAQIIKIIKEDETLAGDITLSPAEGELLPETYVYSYGYTRNDLIHRMMEDRKNFLEAEWKKKANGLPYKSPEDALAMASIVEKETGLPEERPHIAGIFINRIKNGMPLQSDPTTIYAITKGQQDLGRPLTLQDLKIASPYNTYYSPGLPPGPIANPGKESIKAALNPLQTNDLYFVASGNGGHLFAASLAEHNKNVQNYRNVKKAAVN